MYISTSRWSADAVTRHYPDPIADSTVGSQARRPGSSRVTAVQHHLQTACWSRSLITVYHGRNARMVLLLQMVVLSCRM